MPPNPVPEELVELTARRFRALGESLRIRLLHELRSGEATVNELAEAVDASQANVSRHLQLLAETGIVARRKQGNHVYYRVIDEGVFRLFDEVCGSVQARFAELGRLLQKTTR